MGCKSVSYNNQVLMSHDLLHHMIHMYYYICCNIILSISPMSVYMLNGLISPIVNNLKYLGIIFSTNLSFNLHINLYNNDYYSNMQMCYYG